ncbi:MAG: polyamine aminopropyltransferase [Desulfobacteraceae bacterium]|jgi:spermidine synthase
MNPGSTPAVPVQSLSDGRRRLATSLLALTMFFTGACGLVSEYALGAVSSYILGNSIEQMCMTIAVMMLMMAAGSYIQIIFKKNLVETFIHIELAIAIIGGFAPLAMYAAFGFLEHHFILVQYFFICSMGLLIGLEIPVVLRINQEYSKSLGVNVANVYGPDYIGAFMGAVIWVYYLLRNFPITEISFMMAGVNLFVAVVTFSYFYSLGLVRKKVVIFILIILTFAALVLGFMNNRRWSVALEQRLYDDKVVSSILTKYQQLVMTYRKEADEHRLYINGNLQFSSVDEAIYHEQLVHPVMSLVPDHPKVLILGGGDGMALREVLKYDDVKSVTLVDIDPDMVEFSRTNPVMTRLNKNALADQRVTVLHPEGVDSQGVKNIFQETGELKTDGNGKPYPDVVKTAVVKVLNIDADKFIETVREKYNVIIIDFPDPNAIELAKLYSREFYLKLKNILSENGMFVVQSTSPYHAKEAFLCVKRTIASAGFAVIPYHDNVPSFGDWGWILGWKKQAIPHEVIQNRIATMDIKPQTRYITPEVFRSALVFGKGRLDETNKEINTLMRPVVLDLYTREGWKIE